MNTEIIKTNSPVASLHSFAVAGKTFMDNRGFLFYPSSLLLISRKAYARARSCQSLNQQSQQKEGAPGYRLPTSDVVAERFSLCAGDCHKVYCLD